MRNRSKYTINTILLSLAMLGATMLVGQELADNQQADESEIMHRRMEVQASSDLESLLVDRDMLLPPVGRR